MTPSAPAAAAPAAPATRVARLPAEPAETGGGAAGESLPPAAGQVPVPAWSTPGTGEGAYFYSQVRNPRTIYSSAQIKQLELRFQVALITSRLQSAWGLRIFRIIYSYHIQ